MRAREWVRSLYVTEDARPGVGPLQERQYELMLEECEGLLRSRLEPGLTLLAFVDPDGAVRVVRTGWRDPQDGEVIDEELTTWIAVTLDTEWDPDRQAIVGCKPEDVVAKVGRAILASEHDLAVESVARDPS